MNEIVTTIFLRISCKMAQQQCSVIFLIHLLGQLFVFHRELFQNICIYIDFSLHHILILKKLEQPHKDITISIHICGNVIAHNDYLAERIVYLLQRGKLLLTLLFRWQRICRLDVVLVETIRGNEVYLILLVGTLAITHHPTLHHTDIHHIATDTQLIVDDILHDVGNLLLPEIQSGITQADIHHIIFLDTLIILPAFYIIAASTLEEESILQALHIGRHCIRIKLYMLHTLQSITYLARIGQRSDTMIMFFLGTP